MICVIVGIIYAISLIIKNHNWMCRNQDHDGAIENLFLFWKIIMESPP